MRSVNIGGMGGTVCICHCGYEVTIFSCHDSYVRKRLSLFFLEIFTACNTHACIVCNIYLILISRVFFTQWVPLNESNIITTDCCK